MILSPEQALHFYQIWIHLLDYYVQHNPKPPNVGLTILMDWKNAIVDSFVILRHLIQRAEILQFSPAKRPFQQEIPRIVHRRTENM